jgi:hypothetical protein
MLYFCRCNPLRLDAVALVRLEISQHAAGKLCKEGRENIIPVATAIAPHADSPQWITIFEKESKMIDISNSTAEKICRLLEHFKQVTADIPRTNKTDNARREAGRIINYINKKKKNESN